MTNRYGTYIVAFLLTCVVGLIVVLQPENRDEYGGLFTLIVAIPVLLALNLVLGIFCRRPATVAKKAVAIVVGFPAIILLAFVASDAMTGMLIGITYFVLMTLAIVLLSVFSCTSVRPRRSLGVD
jgi:predicted neutral ceramidase superfamily lipid hydrolase